MSNIRFVPIQKLCMLCSEELPTHDTPQGLADRLCHTCIQLLQEKVFFRELEVIEEFAYSVWHPFGLGDRPNADTHL